MWPSMHLTAVAVGDSRHDGQAEPGSLAGDAVRGGQSTEGLEQGGKLVGRDERSGVFDGELCVAVGCVGGDIDGAVFGQVVADGVVYEVVREPFQQDGIRACPAG